MTSVQPTSHRPDIQHLVAAVVEELTRAPSGAASQKTNDRSPAILLARQVARLRRRPIQLCPISMQDETLYGAWLASDDVDYVFFERDTARVHQEHIIIHELSHILCGHTTYTVRPDSIATDAILTRTLRRHSREELEAENLAHAIQEAFIRQAGLGALTLVSTTPVWNAMLLGLGLDRA